jgi:hypothetical protein
MIAIIGIVCVVLVLCLVLVLKGPMTRKPAPLPKERELHSHGPRASGLN